MTYTANDFNKFCSESAEQFLQTVVVIDNEAVFCDAPCKIAEQIEDVQELEAPPAGALGVQNVQPALVEVQVTAPPLDEVGEDADLKEDLGKNVLKAKPLIDAFADKGVVCSIIRPDIAEEKVVERAVTLASVADVVVVDWALGKTQEGGEDQRAREIIKGIIEGDLKNRGRLRLIAIYTAEGNPATILDSLYEYIQVLAYPDPLIKDAAKFTIQNRFLKIVILLKTAAGEHIPNIKPVDFHALPEKLQELFSELNRGLLPSVTLRAIAAIREGTHHLLAVLHKDLDSALVGHRCLLPHPEDAEEFCEDLVAGEIRSILALAKIGKEYAGKKQNEMWVASRLSCDGSMHYGELRATPEQISDLLSKEEGDRHKLFKSKVKTEWAVRNDRKPEKAPSLEANLIPQFLNGDEAGGAKINHEFARLASFKREAFGLRQPTVDWVPRLTLGTVLQRIKDGRIFLCLQPRCESVRLDKNEMHSFPLLEMERGKQKECIIVNTVGADNNPVEKKLYFESKPKNQAIFQFKSISGNSITAKKKGNFYIFSAYRTKFYWLGDLKDPLAQNIVGKMSDEVGSVGINPYEWQRRQGK